MAFKHQWAKGQSQGRDPWGWSRGPPLGVKLGISPVIPCLVCNNRRLNLGFQNKNLGSSGMWWWCNSHKPQQFWMIHSHKSSAPPTHFFSSVVNHIPFRFPSLICLFFNQTSWDGWSALHCFTLTFDSPLERRLIEDCIAKSRYRQLCLCLYNSFLV